MALDNKQISALLKAFVAIKSEKQCREFLEDICTVKEIQAMAQRLEVAKLLNDKKTFTKIVEETGTSTATISRVNKCLMYGSGGYASVLNDNEK